MKAWIFLAAAATIPAVLADPHRVALACAQDAAQFCPNDHGKAQRACLAQHHVSLSLVCRQALAAMKPDGETP